MQKRVNKLIDQVSPTLNIVVASLDSPAYTQQDLELLLGEEAVELTRAWGSVVWEFLLNFSILDFNRKGRLRHDVVRIASNALPIIALVDLLFQFFRKFIFDESFKSVISSLAAPTKTGGESPLGLAYDIGAVVLNESGFAKVGVWLQNWYPEASVNIMHHMSNPSKTRPGCVLHLPCSRKQIVI